jgi:hypothetical protein
VGSGDDLAMPVQIKHILVLGISKPVNTSNTLAISKIPNTKRAGGVAQAVGPMFKPWYRRKKKKAFLVLQRGLESGSM